MTVTRTPAAYLLWHQVRRASALRKLPASPVFGFVLASLAFGIASVYLTPPLFGIDEATHFARIISITERHFSPEVRTYEGQERIGSFYPRQLVYMTSMPATVQGRSLHGVWQLFEDPQYNRPTDWNDKIAGFYEGAAIYNPLAYSEYVVSAEVGKKLHLTPIDLVILMRLSGLLLYIAIVAAAIRLARHGRWALAFFAATPAPVYLAATMNADGIAIALSFLLVGVLSRIFADRAIAWRWLSLALVIVVASSLIKVVYGLLGLLLLTIPWRYFASKKRYALWSTVVVVASAVPGLLWTRAVQPYMVITANFYRDSFGAINYDQQLQFVLHHPWLYLYISAAYIVTGFGGIFGGIHNSFSWNGINMPFLAVLLVFLAWFLAPFMTESKPHTRPPLVYACVFPAVAAMVLLAIQTALYLGFTPVGSHSIAGIQGRYFIPLVPPLILALSALPFVTVRSGPHKLYMAASLAAAYGLAALALFDAFSRGIRIF